MSNYSPISRIQIKNFRNIGEAELDFHDSPIISLIGENEAGKTSVVKAFSVCAIHSTPRDQKDYIRDGSNGFGVAIELEDGTVVTRIKTPTLNRYNVKRADGTVWDATKLEGLPVEVQSVMGLIEEPETKEYLQIRTYEDQLLFVVTPASTNYKVMYNALKVGQLTNAIKIGSKEANALKQEVNNNETGIETLTSSLRGIKTYDIEPLIKIKNRLSQELLTLNKLRSASNLKDQIRSKQKQLGALIELENSGIKEINELIASKIESVQRIANNIENKQHRLKMYVSLDNISEIDIAPINKLCSLQNRQISLSKQIQQAGAINEIDKASEINEALLNTLIQSNNILTNLKKMETYLSIIDISSINLVEQNDFDTTLRAQRILELSNKVQQLVAAEKKVNDYCDQMSNYIKSLGAAVEICPNCGESVVIDIDKYTSSMGVVV